MGHGGRGGAQYCTSMTIATPTWEPTSLETTPLPHACTAPDVLHHRHAEGSRLPYCMLRATCFINRKAMTTFNCTPYSTHEVCSP